MTDKKIPYTIHQETYRGVSFRINETIIGRIGMLDDGSEHLRGRYFCTFLTDEERERWQEETPERMRLGIDRMLAGLVVSEAPRYGC